MAALTLNNIAFAYGRKTILNNISFQVHTGEIVGLLGPNGAGKSTLMSLLSGINKPQSGEIIFANHDSKLPKHAKLTLAPQNFAFYPMLTVEENLKFFIGMQGNSKEASKTIIDDVVAMTCLQIHWKTRADNLSGGWKRRLNLAIALLSDPLVLLLDEPTAGVDPNTREALLQTIIQLKKRGKAIIYTSHYLDEVEKIADRLIILNQGEIQLADSMANVIQIYGRSGVLEFSEMPSQHAIESLTSIAKYTLMNEDGMSVAVGTNNSDAIPQHRIQLQFVLHPEQSLAQLWHWLAQTELSPISMHIGQASLEHLYATILRQAYTTRANEDLSS